MRETKEEKRKKGSKCIQFPKLHAHLTNKETSESFRRSNGSAEPKNDKSPHSQKE